MSERPDTHSPYCSQFQLSDGSWACGCRAATSAPTSRETVLQTIADSRARRRLEGAHTTQLYMARIAGTPEVVHRALRFANHHSRCPATDGMECTCGFDEALEQLYTWFRERHG